MKKSRAWKSVAIVVLFCAASVIALPAQTFSTLYSFTGLGDGWIPYGRLVQANDGNFYGTTYDNPNLDNGTVYKVTSSGTFTRLHSFTYYERGGESYAGLVQGTDGNFYGVTTVASGGMVFKITSSGTFTRLHSFSGPPTDGLNPYAPLIQANDGNFYGTTFLGGTSNFGTVFRITTGGTVTILHAFCTQSGCPDGGNPRAGLVQASDGNLYGETLSGGANNYGSIFKISTSGTLTTVHSFNSTDGTTPDGGLVQASDGTFYGTTLGGGANNYGTVFKMTPSGTLTQLYSFCSQANCADGASPYAGLLQGRDGNFYGTTHDGGNFIEGQGTYGTVFSITPSGTLTTLYKFCSQANCADGGRPYAGLIQATNGNLYGTTTAGGANGGTVFELQLPPTLTVSTSGDGTVASTDGFIHCPGTCSHTYPEGTPVTLDATPGQGWVFGGWNGACLGTGSCTVTMTQSLSVDAIFSQAQQFVAVTPCRLIDTRLTGGPIPGGTFRSFPIPQEGGCNIPDTAAAYSLNVTVVPHGQLGYLTIWPTGEGRPVVATLNSLDGRIKADAAIVAAGTNGAVSVYVTQTTNVILDINGYFAAASGSTLAFYPLTPCRVADTRNSSYPQGLGPPYLSGGQERDFPILAATSCNIPASAAAYSLNFSVVPHGALYYMTVWPTGESRPVVSTLNDIPGTIIANAAIVPAGASGDISVYPTNDTDLVIDINGYFAPEGPNGLSLYAVAPCRVIDTRNMGGRL